MADFLEGLWLKVQALAMSFKSWLGGHLRKVWKGGGDYLCESATLHAVKLHAAVTAGASSEDTRKDILESISNVLTERQVSLMRSGEFSRMVAATMRGESTRLSDEFGVDAKDIASKWSSTYHFYNISNSEDGGFVDACRFWFASEDGLEIFADGNAKIISLGAYKAAKKAEAAGEQAQQEQQDVSNDETSTPAEETPAEETPAEETVEEAPADSEEAPADSEEEAEKAAS